MMAGGEEDPRTPYPGIGAAVLLTIMASIASLFTTVAVFGLGPLAAHGIGRLIGVGSVAAMAAQRVGAPQADRIGARRFELDALPLILCLVPAMLVVSELDNWAYDLAGGGATPPEAVGEATTDEYDVVTPFDEAPASAEAGGDESANSEVFDPEDPFSLTQGLIVLVGIIPLVDCFLFFGIIQQGLVRRMGLQNGTLITALLWTLMRLPMPTTAGQFLVGGLSWIALGHLLGLLRVATGSIVGPMILASGWSAIQFLALATIDRAPLPGLNVPGTHLPIMVAVGSVVVAGWAVSALTLEAAKRFALDPVWRDADRTGRGPGDPTTADDPRGAQVYRFPPVPRPSHLDDDASQASDAEEEGDTSRGREDR